MNSLQQSSAARAYACVFGFEKWVGLIGLCLASSHFCVCMSSVHAFPFLHLHSPCWWFTLRYFFLVHLSLGVGSTRFSFQFGPSGCQLRLVCLIIHSNYIDLFLFNFRRFDSFSIVWYVFTNFHHNYEWLSSVIFVDMRIFRMVIEWSSPNVRG